MPESRQKKPRAEYAGFASPVTLLREKLGITQTELSDRMGVSSQAVSHWEAAMTLPSGPREKNLGSMRNPKSFELVSVLAMPSGAVCYRYRAQNGFGGLNVEQALLLKDGSRIKTSSMDGFRSAWAGGCAGKVGNDLKDDMQKLLQP
jgi:hypothetical protein